MLPENEKGGSPRAEGKPQLSLKTRLHKLSRMTEEALISSLESQDVDWAAFSSRKLQQQYDPCHDQTQRSLVGVLAKAWIGSWVGRSVLEQQGHHGAMMLSQLWVLERLPPGGRTYLSHRGIPSRTLKSPVLPDYLHTAEQADLDTRRFCFFFLEKV